MFDIIAHKEGAKLLENLVRWGVKESTTAVEMLKQKTRPFSWVPGLDFHRWTKTMIGTVNN